jgi:Fe2+ transport system protein FeoA
MLLKRVTGMTLNELPVGGTGVISAVGGQGALRCRLLDMGLTPGTRVHIVKLAPMGDPVELELRGYSLTLRLEDAKEISLGGHARA